MNKRKNKKYNFEKFLVLSILTLIFAVLIFGVDVVLNVVALLMILIAVAIVSFFTNTKSTYSVNKLKEVKDRELTEEEKNLITRDKRTVTIWRIVKIVLFFALPFIGNKLLNPKTNLGMFVVIILIPISFISLCIKIYENNENIGMVADVDKLEVVNFNKPMQYMLLQRYGEYYKRKNNITKSSAELHRVINDRIQSIIEQNGYDYYKGWKWGKYVEDKRETYGGLIELLYTERKYVTDNYLKAENEIMTEDKAIQYLNELALSCKPNKAVLDVVCFLKYKKEGRDETGRVFEDFIHEKLEHPYQNFRSSWRKKQQWKDGLIDKYNYLISTLNDIKEEYIEDAKDYYAIDSLRYVKAIEFSVNLLTQELRAVRRIDIDMTTTPRKVRHNICN